MSLLLYGCYGYTGRLLLDEALRTGLRPILAGRNRDEVEAMARTHALPSRVFALDDPQAIELGGVTAVLHSAGPFSKTAAPMLEACLRAGTHYLDVTGEIAVFEALAARDAEAKARGIMVLPGVGFDVVPSDCLAAHVAAKVPGASELTLAISTPRLTSQGTALTMLENAGAGGAVRRDGRIIGIPAGARERDVDFGDGPRRCVAIGWGDVATAYHSTKIPDIEVYMRAPWTMRAGLRALGYVRRLATNARVRRFVARRIKAGPAGPSDADRADGWSRVYAEARAPDGRHAAARLTAPEAYTLTAMTGIRVAAAALAGDVRLGFQTPSLAYGADFILGVPGVVRTDVA